jgi:hypothetical protein
MKSACYSGRVFSNVAGFHPVGFQVTQVVCVPCGLLITTTHKQVTAQPTTVVAQPTTVGHRVHNQPTTVGR